MWVSKLTISGAPSGWKRYGGGYVLIFTVAGKTASDADMPVKLISVYVPEGWKPKYAGLPLNVELAPFAKEGVYDFKGTISGSEMKETILPEPEEILRKDEEIEVERFVPDEAPKTSETKIGEALEDGKEREEPVASVDPKKEIGEKKKGTGKDKKRSAGKRKTEKVGMGLAEIGGKLDLATGEEKNSFLLFLKSERVSGKATFPFPWKIKNALLHSINYYVSKKTRKGESWEDFFYAPNPISLVLEHGKKNEFVEKMLHKCYVDYIVSEERDDYEKAAAMGAAEAILKKEVKLDDRTHYETYVKTSADAMRGFLTEVGFMESLERICRDAECHPLCGGLYGERTEGSAKRAKYVLPLLKASEKIPISLIKEKTECLSPVRGRLEEIFVVSPFYGKAVRIVLTKKGIESDEDRTDRA